MSPVFFLVAQGPKMCIVLCILYRLGRHSNSFLLCTTPNYIVLLELGFSPDWQLFSAGIGYFTSRDRTGMRETEFIVHYEIEVKM